MPLVVPGVTTESTNKTDQWMQKLVGKTLSDDKSDEVCRVIQPGQMVTKDYRPERLNVQVNKDGTVAHVHYG
ncbi:unnamed protein product [Parascedosporium putredinis]|uniref:Proteinase inhibitor I78 n=1 Tax=Parascedosporium putredinis TaxID=1442378 RepID=A0A9P1M853_9PEZI|nr:unnamed protein product [Parascedosporium putredinis]CAI7989487.1 unnamed protein product [Parascedosporium putredinis]